MKRIIIFENNIKPYISEITGGFESLRNVIFEDLPVKLACKPTKMSDFVVVYAENGLTLRLKQNSHFNNIVGPFGVVKFIDGEILNPSAEEIKKIMKKDF